MASCSGITTDGEYWIYPTATNGRRTKIYCHNLDSVPVHYVTLKNTNRFIGHSPTNWVVQFQECQTDFKAPLTSVDFVKIQINIEVCTSPNLSSYFTCIFLLNYLLRELYIPDFLLRILTLHKQFGLVAKWSLCHIKSSNFVNPIYVCFNGLSFKLSI